MKNISFIGVGIMGRGHLGGFLGNRGVQVVAVCDVHQGRLDDAVERVHRSYAEERKSGTYRGCSAIKDFRELIGRRDIDAVVIATPDHWHARIAIDALEAGKHVYVEKPMALTIEEVRLMRAAQKKSGVATQVGNHGHSDEGMRRLVEYIQSGALGQIHDVWAFDDRLNAMLYRPPKAEPPKGMDWDAFSPLFPL